MSAVTKQEIVSLIEGLIESDACMGSISDKQVVMALEVVSRIKQHGIAPPDGWVLAKDNPVAWWNGKGKICKQAVKDWDAKTGGTMSIGFDIPLYAAAPEVKP